MSDEAVNKPAPVQVSSLEDLARMCRQEMDATIPVRTPTGFAEMRVPCRGLSPDQTLTLELMLREVMPPLRVKKTPEEPDIYDTNNIEWVQKKVRREHDVRCLTVWFGCRLFDKMRAERADLTVAGIVPIVCEQIADEGVLRQLESCIVGAAASIQDRVNFTSGAYLES